MKSISQCKIYLLTLTEADRNDLGRCVCSVNSQRRTEVPLTTSLRQKSSRHAKLKCKQMLIWVNVNIFTQWEFKEKIPGEENKKEGKSKDRENKEKWNLLLSSLQPVSFLVYKCSISHPPFSSTHPHSILITLHFFSFSVISIHFSPLATYNI